MLAASSGRSAHGWRRFPHADAHVLPLHHTGDEHSPPGSLSQLSCPRCRPNSAPSPRKWPPRTASRPADSKGSVRTQRAPEPTLGRRAPCTVPGSSAAWGRQCGLGYHPPSAHSSRGRTHRVRSLQPAGQHGGCCGQALPAPQAGGDRQFPAGEEAGGTFPRRLLFQPSPKGPKRWKNCGELLSGWEKEWIFLKRRGNSLASCLNLL